METDGMGEIEPSHQVGGMRLRQTERALSIYDAACANAYISMSDAGRDESSIYRNP